MKIEVKNFKGSLVGIFRQAGYIFQHREEGEMSFIKPLAKSGYPRFHAYIIHEGKDLILKIHLDQKKETYGKNLRHHGEYGNDGPLKEETERLKKIFG